MIIPTANFIKFASTMGELSGINKIPLYVEKNGKSEHWNLNMITGFKAGLCS